MCFEQIIKMLREFYYEKNGLRSTIEFLSYISFALYELDQQQMKDELKKIRDNQSSLFEFLSKDELKNQLKGE